MKKTIVGLLFMHIVGTASAQQIRLNPYGTGVFGDKVESYDNPTSFYKGKVNGGFQWGSGIEYRMQKNLGIEFLYLRQETKAPIEYYDANLETTQQTNFDQALNFLLLGGVVSINPNKKIEPFAEFLAGLALMRVNNPDDAASQPGKANKFAWGLRGGVNIWVTKVVGIRLQSQLLSVSRAVGGEIYFGPSANTNPSTYTSISQFGLGAGLTFKLGR